MSVKGSVVTIRFNEESGRYTKDGVHWIDDTGAKHVLIVDLDLEQGCIVSVRQK